MLVAVIIKIMDFDHHFDARTCENVPEIHRKIENCMTMYDPTCMFGCSLARESTTEIWCNVMSHSHKLVYKAM